MMATKPVIAVGYIRVSTAEQAEKGESLSTQRQQITDFCKQKSWHLAHVYADEGISGTKVEYRTDFKKMIEDAEGGKFEVIVFTKLSRFARNARDYMNKSHELEEHGVSLVSVKENIDPTTKTGKMIGGILALFAEWEHETIKEQMYENKMAKWKDHRTFIGKPPYGYRWNKDKNQLEIDKKEAEIYNWIVKMYVEQGMSSRDICIKLKEHGVMCNKAQWSSTTVIYALKNPAYYGHYVVNQYVYEDRVYKDGRIRAGTTRTKRKKPISEHITYTPPPLITKSVWDQIQQRTEFNKRKSKRSGRTKTFFLRDVLVCGHCGGRVKPRFGVTRKYGSAPRYYACYWAGTSEKDIKAAGRPSKCSLRYLKAEEVEKRVWNDLWATFNMKIARNPEKALGRLFNPDEYKTRMEQLQETINRLDAEVKKKQRAKDNLFKFMEDENMDKDELSRRLKVNRDQILELEGNLNNARLQYRELESLQEKEQETRDFLLNNKSKFKQLRRDIGKLDLDDRKVLVESMLREKIVVDYQEGNEVDGPGGVSADFKPKWNTDILQRFMNEGKISRLNQDSYDSSCLHPVSCILNP